MGIFPSIQDCLLLQFCITAWESASYATNYLAFKKNTCACVISS